MNEEGNGAQAVKAQKSCCPVHIGLSQAAVDDVNCDNSQQSPMTQTGTLQDTMCDMTASLRALQIKMNLVPLDKHQNS